MKYALILLIALAASSCSRNNGCSGSMWVKVSNFRYSITELTTNGVTLCASAGDGFISQDGGSTWKCVSNTLKQALISSGDYDTLFLHLYINGNALYGFYENQDPTYATISYNPCKLYKSTDNGITWSLRGEMYNQIINSLAFQNGKIFCLDGRNNFYVSTDDGSTFFKTASFQQNYYDDYAMYSDSLNLYVRNWGILSRSTDGGNSFVSIQGSYGTGCPSTRYDIATIGTSLFVINGCYDNIFKSIAGGPLSKITTSGINNHIIDQPTRSISSVGGALFLGIENRVFMSNDLGLNWSQVGCDLSSNSGLTICPERIVRCGSYLYANTTDGIYKIQY